MSVIVVDPHTHDWDAPLPPSQNAELQVRLPQPEPSLARVLEPLPFPTGIIENLKHVVAYADQAGYLVNYAHERFNQLDKDFHLQGKVLEERNAAIAQLKQEVKQLGDGFTVEKAKVADLTKRLDEARATYEAKLKEKDEVIKKDEDQIKKDKGHDIDDHKTIDRLASQLEYERASKAEVQKNLDLTKTELAAAEASLTTAGATIANLTTLVASLEAELEVEKKDIDKLKKENKDKTGRISQLEKDNADLQSKLNGALQDVKSKQDQINAKDSIIRDQSTRIDNLTKESNAKSITINNLQSQINDLQQQIRNLQATPVFKFKCNIKCQVPSNREIAVDLTNGGGAGTPVQCYSLVNNNNQIWDIYSVTGRNNVVIIKNTRNNYVLWSAGRNQKARCDPGKDTSDQATQWELEGTTIDSINNNTVFKIRNLKYGMYLDLQQGNPSNCTPFLTWDGNNGSNQKFKISKH
ncbi:hard-surface inducible [Fusarium circinatum]|uniref:Hard-surface inducible n=1 Tax=Fusarium circinatum TaxID=48490 RepID=A0A8H5WKP3_FUSCI|nr:hard-surface inducible [Fusarium circinatum]